ncbi:oxidoreductase [Saccharata proteae CBS 121410]|uniref:Oxidoreductase n=1 Tax=Saccharata proteae CBS 121410 TaxID=1314787 RepID=A0A9P4I2A8_9PEZI|nr:oxidoreductase [Saccharata proteae CBS 121410]
MGPLRFNVVLAGRLPVPAVGTTLPRALQACSRRFQPNTLVRQCTSDLNRSSFLRSETRGYSTANVGGKRFQDFDLAGRVYVVTGGGRGLGLCMAEALVEAGGKVYCLDIQPKPGVDFDEANARISPEYGGSLNYEQIDVRDTKSLNRVIGGIADEHQRLDGLIAAAAVQKICSSLEYSVEETRQMMDVNYTGVFMTATAAAAAMFKYKCRGNMCLVASMSGTVANKGLLSPVYNSSKAALLQLTRNLAMEWSHIRADGSGGLRVNSLSPGHIITPMVKKNFDEVPGLKQTWERENMLGRLSQPEEFKGAGLFLLSNASSFMTGANLIIDGGHTAW